MEIVIDGVVYEAHEKKEQAFKPQRGDFVVNTKPAHGFWIVERVLYSIIKDSRIVVVGENRHGNFCVTNRPYKNYLKDNRIYCGCHGASDMDREWWCNNNANIKE